ncbi:hypothetical protein AX16_004497, partial [Volvariella volvacea WC 439]
MNDVRRIGANGLGKISLKSATNVPLSPPDVIKADDAPSCVQHPVEALGEGHDESDNEAEESDPCPTPRPPSPVGDSASDPLIVRIESLTERLQTMNDTIDLHPHEIGSDAQNSDGKLPTTSPPLTSPSFGSDIPREASPPPLVPDDLSVSIAPLKKKRRRRSRRSKRALQEDMPSSADMSDDLASGGAQGAAQNGSSHLTSCALRARDDLHALAEPPPKKQRVRFADPVVEEYVVLYSTADYTHMGLSLSAHDTDTQLFTSLSPSTSDGDMDSPT